MTATERKLLVVFLLLLLLGAFFWFILGGPSAPPEPAAAPAPAAATPSTAAVVTAPAPVPAPEKAPVKAVAPLKSISPAVAPPAVALHKELIPKNIEIVRCYYAQEITSPQSSFGFDINGSGFTAEFEKMITVEAEH